MKEGSYPTLLYEWSHGLQHSVGYGHQDKGMCIKALADRVAELEGERQDRIDLVAQLRRHRDALLDDRSGEPSILAANKSSWQIAEAWYSLDEITRSVARAGKQNDESRAIPPDVRSPEFAKWMTREYRLAMSKGIQLGRG